MSFTLTGLYSYPVKALRGHSQAEALVERRGLQHDRRWMVVDAEGLFLTQREHPLMARIEVEVTPDGLHLQAEGASPLQVPYPNDPATRHPVVIWKDTVDALDAGDEAARWLSTFLDIPCRLVHQPDDSLRPVDPRFRTRADDHVSFADGYPILLLTEASLEDLNGRLETPVPMTRFRPNFVVQGPHAFAEDTWQRIRIGDVTFDLVKPCARCVVITTDQQTGARSKEPLRTLSTYRRAPDGKVYFGQNLIPVTTGTVHLGDPVVVLG